MRVGRSLHVGINRYSSAFPNATELDGPENSAARMRDLVCGRFQTELVQGANANRQTIEQRLLHYAEVSESGDIFLFTFSGHGTSIVREFDPDRDELDDEAILLHDFWLYDDELRLNIWPRFHQGVRVLMIADSCHSGTILRAARCTKVLQISTETREAHLREHGWFYRQLMVPVFAPVEASVLLLAACGDNDETPDGSPLTGFTEALVRVLEEQNPRDYNDLLGKIRMQVGPQIPQLAFLPAVDKEFIGQRPFTI